MTRLTLDLANVKNINDADKVRATFQALVDRGDTKVRMLNDGTLIELDYGLEDLKPMASPSEFPGGITPMSAIKMAYGLFTKSDQLVQMLTPKEQWDVLAETLEEAREACRDFDYDEDVADVSDDLDQPGTDAITDILGNEDGLLLGGSHADATHRQPVMDMLESGAMSSDNGVGLVFIEEFTQSLQPAIDEFLGSDDDAPMNASLQAWMKTLSGAYKTDFVRMLELSKQRGIRVVGTDAADAKVYGNSCNAQHHEQRCAKQNKVSVDIMKAAVEKARQDGKPTKFVGMIGAAHSNTHEGGVPGISQLMGVPAVTADATGRLHAHTEDESKRGAPEKLVASFIDVFLDALTAEHGDMHGNLVDWTEQREAGERLAELAKWKGTLTEDADLKELMKDKAVVDMIAEVKAKGELRKTRQEELIKLVKAGNESEFKSKLAEYQKDMPKLLTFDTSVVEAAVAAGRTELIKDLKAKGAKIDDPDVAQKLFKNVIEKRSSDLRKMSEQEADRALTHAIHELVRVGVDPNGKNTLGNTPLQMLVEQGLGQHVNTLIRLGASKDVRTAPEVGGSPPMPMAAHAVIFKKPDALGALIDQGADMNMTLPDGRSLIEVALREGDAASAKLLLEKGATLPVNMGADGKTPLHLAAELGDQSLIDELVRKGADPSVADTSGKTAAAALLEREVRNAIDKELNHNRREALRLETVLADAEKALEAERKALDEKTAEFDRLKSAIDVPPDQTIDPKDLRAWAQAREDMSMLEESVATLETYCDTVENDLEAAENADPMKDFIVAAGQTVEEARKSVELGKDAVALAKIHRKDATGDENIKAADKRVQNAESQLMMLEMNLRSAERELERVKQPQPLDEELVAEAAASIAGQTPPTDMDGIAEAMAKSSTEYVVDALAGDMVERKAQAEALKTAIDADDLDAIRTLLTKTPTLVNGRVPGEEESFNRTMLGYAASSLKSDVMELLLERDADPDLTDNSGCTAMHRVFFARQDDAAVKEKQAELLAMLRDKGADINAPDRMGMTPLHKACLDGNADAIEYLVENGANLDAQDSRGWKPKDVAIATTKPLAEATLEYFSGRELSPSLIQPNEESVDTVTMLMRATKCEDPAAVERVEAMYRDLYAQPAFRKMLDLLAADAAHAHEVALEKDEDDKTVTKTETGLRIFIAADRQVGMLYNRPQGDGLRVPHIQSPRGAYEEHAHVIQVGGKEQADHSIAGTLIHELTHCAARIMFGDETIPCPPPDPDAEDGGYYNDNKTASGDLDNDPYLTAIMADAKSSALFETSDTKSDAYNIWQTLFKRLNGYKKRGDKALLQEYLVSVPQLIAQYGEDAVKRVAPQLVQYYKGAFSDKCEEVLNSDRYEDVADKFDNTALVVALQNEGRPRITEPDLTIESSDARCSVDGMMKTWTQLYNGEHGTRKTVGTVSVPCTGNDFELTDAAKIQTRDRLKRNVKAALEKAFKGPDALPPSVSMERIAAMTDELWRCSGQLTGNALKNAIKAATSQFVLGARRDHLEARYENGERLTNAEMAEIVVLRAEEGQWKKTNPTGGDPHPKVDLGDHDKLVRMMKEKLDQTFDHSDPKSRRVLAKVLSDRDAFVDEQVKVLVDHASALRGDGDVVKLKSRKAKNVWYSKLRTLAA